jgi:hypothetical protein
MKYVVVYRGNREFDVKSKALAVRDGEQIVCEFGNFYDAVEWLHSQT